MTGPTCRWAGCQLAGQGNRLKVAPEGPPGPPPQTSNLQAAQSVVLTCARSAVALHPRPVMYRPFEVMAMVRMARYKLPDRRRRRRILSGPGVGGSGSFSVMFPECVSADEYSHAREANDGASILLSLEHLIRCHVALDSAGCRAGQPVEDRCSVASDSPDESMHGSADRSRRRPPSKIETVAVTAGQHLDTRGNERVGGLEVLAAGEDLSESELLVVGDVLPVQDLPGDAPNLRNSGRGWRGAPILRNRRR